MNDTQWNFDEFLAFLLIYASHVDFDFSKEEKTQIENIVGVEIFETSFEYFQKLTDFQALQKILSYKEVHYSTEAEKEILFREMHKLFNVDGDFSALEKELLLFLRKLM